MFQPYPLSIAVRYLRARKTSGFISFISSVSMLGIALAVAVLIIVLSVTNGFYYELQQRTLGMVSDATISAYEGQLPDWRATRDRALERTDVLAAAPYIEGEAMVFANDALAGLAVRGIDPVYESGVSEIGSFMTAGSLDVLEPDSYKILIGRQLAEQLELGVGDELVLILAQASVTPLGTMPRRRVFEVGGIFDSGMYEYDRGLGFIHLDVASRLFRTQGRATGLRLSVDDIYSAGSIVTAFARDLIDELHIDFLVSDWSRQHAAFFRSIQISKAILAVILSLVIGVAAFNIVSTLVMVVREKRGDIAILRSFGASARGILTLFAAQGSIIGLIGVLLGVLVGVLLAVNLPAIVTLIETVLRTDLFAGEAYLITDLPSRLDGREVALIAVFAFALTILATIYPAISAARQQPAEALRYE